MTTEPVSRSPYRITAVSLMELTVQASTAAIFISKHLHSKSLDDPDFSPTSLGLPEDPEIQDAREALLVASKALTVLATDPLAHLREVFLGVRTHKELVPPFIYLISNLILVCRILCSQGCRRMESRTYFERRRYSNAYF